MAYRFEKDRRLSLVARAQIRYLLSVIAGKPPQAFEFSVDEKGRPGVSPGTPGEGIEFNISHSRDMVVSALGRNCLVGVDVEGRDQTAAPAIAKRFFAPDETAQIMDAPKSERQGLFLKFWTLKEAWIKALGQGLSQGLDTISFDLRRPGRISYTLRDPAVRFNWQFFQFSPQPGAAAAIAVAAPSPRRLDAYHCLPLGELSPMVLSSTMAKSS